MENIKECVEKLPEIYQKIYGHPEYDNESSRLCDDRLEIIKKTVVDYKRNTNKKEIRILDVGCAQGFFDFELAKIGCTVYGLDFCKENIELCQVINRENGMDCSFENDELSLEYVKKIDDNQYDIVIILNVLHHIAYKNGYLYARRLLEILATKCEFVIVELAIKEEPLYWNKTLPLSYVDWFEHVAYYDIKKMIPTHLSNITRPFVFLSNKHIYINDVMCRIEKWSTKAYGAKPIANSCRNYIYGDGKFIKYFRNCGVIRDIEEITSEIEFIKTNGELSFVPTSINYKISGNNVVLLYESEYGENLFDCLRKRVCIPKYKVIWNSVLNQLIELEEKGLYMGDMRPWNIFIGMNGEVSIIDFGDINSSKKDTLDRCLNIDLYDMFIFVMMECEVGIVCDENYDPQLFPHEVKMSLLPQNLKMLVNEWRKVESDDKNFKKIKEIYNQNFICEANAELCTEWYVFEKIKYHKVNHENRKIVLFGAGMYGQLLADILKDRVLAVVDSFKFGESVNNYIIMSPEELFLMKEDYIVIIAIQNHDIKKNVESLLISRGIDIEEIYILEGRKII